MFAPSRGGDFLKMGSRSIGGAVVIATAFKRNTGAGQSRLVSPFLNYSHFLNSPCINHNTPFFQGFPANFSPFLKGEIFF